MAKIKIIIDDLLEGSKIFGESVSSVINLVLLSFVYFFGVGLTSIFGKIFGKKFIEDNPYKESYWEELNLTTLPIKEYYKQF